MISRSILALASYRKTTMNRALRKRPRFWTVPRPDHQGRAEPPRKRLRLQFGETGAGFTVEPGAESAPPRYADAPAEPPSFTSPSAHLIPPYRCCWNFSFFHVSSTCPSAV